MRVQALPPAAPSLGCFSEAKAPQHCPAPTSSAVSGCRAPPGGSAAWDPEAVGEGPERRGPEPLAGPETWHLPGMRVGGGAQAAFGVGFPRFTPTFSLCPTRAGWGVAVEAGLVLWV